MKYEFYAIVTDVAGNTTNVGSSGAPAKSFVTNIQKVTGITINPSGAVTKNIGDTFTFTITISPSDANNKTVNWKSSNTGVATIDTNGKVTCLSAGTTNITATAADGSGVSASLALTVRNPVNSISLSPKTVTIAKGSSATTISATIDPSDYNGDVNWSISGDTSAITMSGTSKISKTFTPSSTTLGTITVTVSAGGKSDTTTINVIAYSGGTYNYTGSVQTIELPAGKWRLECWGAQGCDRGNTNFTGLGGYSTGILTLNYSITAYIYVGGSGNNGSASVGGFNGGGAACDSEGRAGGGASDIRLVEDSLYARVIVAGGGGGGSNCCPDQKGGAGGGSSGKYDVSDVSTGTNRSECGLYGTQVGTGGNCGVAVNLISVQPGFGKGGTGRSSSFPGAGGGGGWYGGGPGCDDGGGGGGSGWTYTESTYNYWSTNSTEGKSGKWLLDSSYYLTDTSMSNGQRSGNGQVKITLVN